MGPPTFGRALAALLVTAPFAGASPLAGHAESDSPWSAEGQRLGSSFVIGSAQSSYWDITRIDSLPPIGVPYTEVLDGGDWLFSYTYKYQSYDGMRDGRSDISTGELIDSGPYATTPSGMTVQTQVFELLYGYDEDWMFFASLPYVSKEMDVEARPPATDYTTEAKGIGDLKFGTIRRLKESENSILRAHLGISVPTGSFDERDQGIALPYVMQLGSGVVDIYPGLTYMVQNDVWSWGAQTRGKVYLFENSDGWAYTNEHQLSIWGARQFSEAVGGSLRVEFLNWGDLHGESKDLDPDVDPSNDEHRQGGNRLDLLGGINVELADGYDTQNRIQVEFGVPIDEWLDGPQLSTEWIATLGWQLSF